MKNININNLTFAYKKDNFIFINASIEIGYDHVTFLQGTNGSGKTTFCRLLSGLERNYSGSIYYDDINLKPISFAERAELFTYIKQEPLSNIVASTPDEDLSLWQNGFTKKSDVSASELRNVVMEKLNISQLKDKPFWELSGGQIKRIGLAAFLINYDKYWILDEPISGLDNSLIDVFIEILKDRKKLGKGCLIISHKEERFLNLTDRFYLIENRNFKAIR